MSAFLMNFQDAASFLKEDMIFFHDYIMFFGCFIVSFVFFLLASILTSTVVNRFMVYSESIELMWTVFPALVLFFIAVPSLALLYAAEVSSEIGMTVKAVGHQWYWSFEMGVIEFSSSMCKSSEWGTFRSLDVDSRLVLPSNTGIRLITTSEDVIHSFTVPSLGIKMDSVPGRLNQLVMESSRSGVFFGQCSEICGVLHSFMPICIEMTGIDFFLKWMNEVLK